LRRLSRRIGAFQSPFGSPPFHGVGGRNKPWRSQKLRICVAAPTSFSGCAVDDEQRHHSGGVKALRRPNRRKRPLFWRLCRNPSVPQQSTIGVRARAAYPEPQTGPGQRARFDFTEANDEADCAEPAAFESTNMPPVRCPCRFPRRPAKSRGIPSRTRADVRGGTRTKRRLLGVTSRRANMGSLSARSRFERGAGRAGGRTGGRADPFVSHTTVRERTRRRTSRSTTCASARNRRPRWFTCGRERHTGWREVWSSLYTARRKFPSISEESHAQN
jgi:hypothetical protein